MKFRKGGGRKKKVNWRWKRRMVEKMREFKYLDYTLQTNEGQEAHIKERVRRAAMVMGQVWA